jgi:hypothetical protein
VLTYTPAVAGADAKVVAARASAIVFIKLIFDSFSVRYTTIL